MDYRLQLLEGVLPLPAQDQFAHKFPTQLDTIQAMWKALWHSYLRNKGIINAPLWYESFNDPKVFNLVVMSLSKAGWITSLSIPERNWGELFLNEDKLLTFVSPEELMDIRAKYKYSTYQLGLKESRTAKVTSLNGTTTDTGLVREGFREAGNTQFGYDTEMLKKYHCPIALNLTKSMDKMRKYYPEMASDAASYDTVSRAILEYHIDNPNDVFTTGNSINDSRGRAISTSLSKIANPISNKDFRSSLVITYD